MSTFLSIQKVGLVTRNMLLRICLISRPVINSNSARLFNHRSIVYAACLEGSDPIRLFEKRLNARRGNLWLRHGALVPHIRIEIFIVLEK